MLTDPLIPCYPLHNTYKLLHLTQVWFMSTLQSLHHIKGTWLHFSRLLNHALLLPYRHDAIQQAHDIGRRDILERGVLLITPRSAHAMRFEQRSPTLAFRNRNVVEESIQGGIFANEESASLP